MHTVADARMYVLDPANLKKGVKCPACRRLCKEQPRRFSFWMGIGLLGMYQFHKQNPTQEFCHVEDLMKDLGFKSQRMRDIQRLALFGLINKRRPQPGTPVQGFWKLTSDGFEFAEKKFSVPYRFWTFRNSVTRFANPMVTILDILGSEPFSYDDLVALKGPAFFEKTYPHAYKSDDDDNGFDEEML